MLSDNIASLFLKALVLINPSFPHVCFLIASLNFQCCRSVLDHSAHMDSLERTFQLESVFVSQKVGSWWGNGAFVAVF